MAHQSLYRAYRPQKFSDVAGQDAIVDALTAQIAADKVGHAYLFAGSRGLGKTSIARIFARELGTTERDLYEIDAASNNSVENIRSLAENIYTLPFESKYKVFILDEAHMLSKGAWNAFLKTLEEPPAHAIFILATTELPRVPDTVQSRCQVFEFKKPTKDGIVKLVTGVAKKEGYALEPDAAGLIAMLADGSYRDALSVLEKVLTAESEAMLSDKAKKGTGLIVINLPLVEKTTGAPKRQFVSALVAALSEGNADKALTAIRKAQDADADMNLFLALVLHALRTVLLIRHAPELRKELEEEQGEEFSALQAIASAKDSNISHQTLKAFLDAAASIRYSPVPALPLELAVLELLGHD